MASKGKAEDPRLKNLRIKTGVVRRLAKEKAMYEKEVVDQAAKVERMKQEGKDEYDIRKQNEVLEESRSMVPDCGRRLEAAHADLSAVMESSEDLASAAEYKAAEEILRDVQV